MKKIKSKKGFTLVEMLACIIALLLLTGICTMGTNMALNSYNRSMFESDSQMLESTLDMYLGDILRHSTLELETQALENGNKKIKNLTNMSYGIYQGMIGVSDDGRFCVYKTPTDTTGVLLLNENVYTKTLKISDFKLEYNEVGQYVEGSYTIESTIVEGGAIECDFLYRIATIY